MESGAHPPLASALWGLDVSHHQKEIDWAQVSRQGAADFVFVKATEGSDFVDSLFASNWDALDQYGIRRGAYHFFRAYGCGDVQAAHFLSHVQMKPGDLAPVLDIEVLDGIDPAIMVEEAQIWLQTVERALGVKPIIYSNLHFYERFLSGHLDGYPLWLARYSERRPHLASGQKWHIWQFANDGCIDGIPQKVDLNFFPGTWDMLEELCWYPRPKQSEGTPALP
jgi:lysozyme